MPRSRNNRKRKNKVYHSSRPKNIFYSRQSHAYLQHIEEVGRKILRMAGVDDSFLDRMTKQQKNAILSVQCEKPRIIIQKGARVPQAYLRYVHSELYRMFDRVYLNDNAEVGLTLTDTASYGIAFIAGLTVYSKRTGIVFGNEVKDVKAALDKLQEVDMFNVWLKQQVIHYITLPLMSISQVQFRLYGFTGGFEENSMGLTIALTSAVPECITFKHFDKRRKAYQFCLGPMLTEEVQPAEVQYRDIFPLCSDEDNRTLLIYIQQHAILRLKERLKILPPTERTMLLYSSFMMSPKIVRGPDDQPLFVAHINKGEVYGYFSFVIQGDKLFILSFLPVTSALTPEGKRLRKLLRLSKKDIVYLGMDSLNFLFRIDLDQIPILKDALIQSGIYQAKDFLHKWLVPYSSTGEKKEPEVDEKQTAFMKKYFEEHPVINPEAPYIPDDDDDDDEHSVVPTGAEIAEEPEA
jgi:hypothetical protein